MKGLPERGSGVYVKTRKSISIQTNSIQPYPPDYSYTKGDRGVPNDIKMGKVKPPLQKPTIQWEILSQI